MLFMFVCPAQPFKFHRFYANIKTHTLWATIFLKTRKFIHHTGNIMILSINITVEGLNLIFTASIFSCSTCNNIFVAARHPCPVYSQPRDPLYSKGDRPLAWNPGS